MRNQLHYRGYTGSVAFSEEDGVFHGKVLGISDLISYEGDSVQALTAEFREFIDEYFLFCEENGREPDEPFVSPYPLRLQPDLRRRAEVAAYDAGLSLSDYVAQFLPSYDSQLKAS
ncbi:MAG: type II toxin-antitoxin system HicB family antitoxin [Oscillospiraceae bacterium]|nr:type II toxin-antitoxin system HicB family antitoxin [Oscillospiraceae bacterium]